MSERYQTQCPHCGVKFQITAQQLQLAGGTVRCGSCLQVFQATQNLVPLTASAPPAGVGSARGTAKTPPPDSQATIQRPAISVPPPKPAAPAARPPAAATPPAARPPAAKPPADEDLADMILRELDAEPKATAKPAAPARPAAPPPPAARPAAPAAPGGWAPPPARPATPAPAQPAAPAAGGWGAPPPPKPAAPAAPAPAAKPQSAAEKYGIQENKTKIRITGEKIGDKLETDDPFGIQSTTLDEKDFEPEADESWAKALIGEKPVDERDERVRKFQISANDLSIADPTAAQPRSALEARLAKLSGNEEAEMPSPIRRTAPAGGTQVDDEFDFLSDPGLTMQDVELPGLDDSGDALLAAAANQHVTWGGDFFWGTLSAVFLLVLLGQYMLFNKETLARDPAWRGAYEVICGAVGCALPKNSDITRIQGANLVIRSHPAVPKALVVDAIIYNRAAFAQSFPRIELGFDDAQGNPVAGRAFRPAEYLKGELLDAKLMPPDTPIHVALEIADPGAGAANYELRFLPADHP